MGSCGSARWDAVSDSDLLLQLRPTTSLAPSVERRLLSGALLVYEALAAQLSNGLTRLADWDPGTDWQTATRGDITDSCFCLFLPSYSGSLPASSRTHTSQ